jgi:hypothetical protein
MKAFIEKAIKADVTQQNALDRAHGKALATLFGLCAHIVDKTDIKEYCDGWAGAMEKIGRPTGSIKAEKSQRKLIIEFATGNRKGCDIPQDEAVNLINSWIADNNSVGAMANKIREHLKPETTDEKAWSLTEAIAKLMTEAEDHGVPPEQIRKAVLEALIPDAE